MRERLAVYGGLAAACGVAGWLASPHLDLYEIVAVRPSALVTTSPVSVVLLLALAAIFFILPSALRRIEPSFRMTALRAAIAVATIFAVGLITEIGYALAVLPGIVVAVLLSQTLVGALLRAPESASLRGVAGAFVAGLRGSVSLTKGRFATTLGVIAASLAILLVPFAIVLLGLVILGVEVPASLIVTAPLLFLTFIYFECVRYAMLVRWYRKLEVEDRSAALP